MSLPRYPEYKPSGVEWLGEVPGHWDIRKIRWLCQIKKRISGELGHDVLSITQHGIKVKDIESNDGQISMDYSKYQFVEIGDFAMNHMDLLTGYVDISNVFGVTSPDYRVFSIRDKKVCYDKYVLYLFQMGYRNKIFYAFGQGSSQLGRWRLPTEQFNDFFFPLPPIKEQQTIAAFLVRETGKIDALIAEQRRLVELLAEKRQAVISHAVTKGLNPNATMKDSGVEWLGEVPEHWAVKPVKAISTCNDDVIEESTSADYEIEYIEISGVDAERGITETTAILFGDSPSRARRRVQNGDVIISTVRTYLRAIAQISNPPENLIISTGFAVIRPKAVESHFLGYLFQAEFLISEVIARSVGISYPAVNASELMRLKVPIPPREEQQTIAISLDRETAKFNALTAEANRAIELLQERRSALISASVTGKIDVRVPQLLEVA